jgi:hypothetical protein
MTIKKRGIPIVITLKAKEFLDDLPGFEFPAGIINKKHTGIGATNAEIKAKRNSILVFPSKSIAYNKSKSPGHEYTFYVGSLSNNKTVTKEQISAYYNNPHAGYKKYLVVADSLHKVFEALGEKEVYKRFFLFFDEIDKFQGESVFRTELENCLDYFLHKDCKGCLVSATVGEFSNRKYAKFQQIVIEKPSQVKPFVNLYKIQTRNEIVRFIYQKLIQYPDEKIVIAHKSITWILNIVSNLSVGIRKDIKILCGENSADRVGQYFGHLDNDLLPGRINFLTAANFSGVDIKEDYHLIIVSDDSTKFSLLTIGEIRQVIGRCRRNLKSIELIIPNNKKDIPLIKKTRLIDKANSLLKKISKHFDDIQRLELDSESFWKSKRNQMQYTSDDVLLIRMNRFKKFRVSSFTIDQFINRNKELRLLYSERRYPIKSLSEYYQISTPRLNITSLDIEYEIKISYLSMLKTNVSSTQLPQEDILSPKNPTEEKVLARYKLCIQLADHSDSSWIIDKAYWNTVSFRKEFIRLYMANLSKYHGIWEYLNSAFEINMFYSRKEARSLVENALLMQDTNIDVTAKDYISILNGFFEIKETTSNKVPGFMAVAMNKPQGNFSVHGSTKVTFDKV